MNLKSSLAMVTTAQTVAAITKAKFEELIRPICLDGIKEYNQKCPLPRQIWPVEDVSISVNHVECGKIPGQKMIPWITVGITLRPRRKRKSKNKNQRRPKGMMVHEFSRIYTELKKILERRFTEKGLLSLQASINLKKCPYLGTKLLGTDF